MSLGLRAGDWVEIRSADEILATLDTGGRLDRLPFMPEMLRFCGQRVPVRSVAHKTCDTIKSYRNRGMNDAVHLGDLRCDGEAHGGCQATCLLFWKEAWLKRAPAPRGDSGGATLVSDAAAARTAGAPSGDLDRLTRATQGATESGGTRYFCQATELVNATTPMHWADPRHYVKDLTTRNVQLGPFLRAMMIAAYNLVMRLHRRGRPYPFIRGRAGDKTPVEALNLQPGERVRIKSSREIMATINKRQRNRGLWFDVEMVPYCGRETRVLKRVERIINEGTGEMMQLPSACIMLEGVFCKGHLSQGRLFCPRAIYPYWREIWLRRVE